MASFITITTDQSVGFASVSNGAEIHVNHIPNMEIQAWYNKQMAEEVEQARLWAEQDENIESDPTNYPNQYSAKHYSLKSGQYASESETHKLAAQAAQSGSEAAQTASETARDASQAAQAASEEARDGSVAAKTASELARDGSVAAKTASEAAQGFAESAQSASELARDQSQTAQAASELARDGSVAAKTASETAQSGAEAAQAASALSATNAATSESNASASAGSAATSATNASNSASSAAQSAADAAAAFDNFNDMYLGSKSVDPTLDNDGQALIVGASYWNTTTNELRFWNGASWDRPEESASQSALAAAQSAADAATSETNASTSEANALASKQAAALSETNAATSETNAAASEASALASKQAAATSETNAAASEAAAASSATSASSSASNAAASASTATTEANRAKTEADRAAASATELAAADSRYVNVSGDTMTGKLTINQTGEALLIGGTTALDSADAHIRIGNGSLDWLLKYVGSTAGSAGNELRFESTNSARYWQMDHDGNFEYFDGAAIRPILHTGNYASHIDGRYVNVTGDTMTGNLTAPTFIGALSGNASTASKWATARTLTLTGDLSGSVSIDGSANVSLSAQVTNDSHTHDGRYYTESEADSRFVNVSGDTITGDLTFSTDHKIAWSRNTDGAWIRFKNTSDSDTDSYMEFHTEDNGNEYFKWTSRSGSTTTEWASLKSDGLRILGQLAFHDGYHPNADKWTTARTLSLTGDVTGSVSWDGSGNVSLSTTVGNDSHTHDGRYYTESEADSRFLNTAGDTFTGDLVSNQRNRSIFGIYDSYKTDQIWSMGTAYRNAADGSNFGNLYGLAYKHTNNGTGGTMAGGHQMVWVTNGVPQAALGDTGIWSAGTVITGNSIGIGTTPGNTFNNGKALAIGDNDTGVRQNGDGVLELWANDQEIAQFTTSGITAHKTITGTLSGNASTASKWATARSLSLSGDASGSVSFDGSANATLSVTVNDDSHSHSNYIAKNTGFTWTSVGGSALSFRSNDTIDTSTSDQASLEVYQDTAGADAFMQFHVAGDYGKYFGLHGGVNDFVVGGWSSGSSYQRVFHDGYHPNADKWTTARTLTLNGDVSGSVAFDGSGNMTMGVTVNDNSHTHTNLTRLGSYFGPDTAQDSYSTIRVYHDGDTNYTIGFKSAQTYGWLNDYAMTFTMNNDTDRGWLWRDASDAASDGAMSLTTNGNLMVKNVIALGGDTSRYIQKAADEGSWNMRSDNGIIWTFGSRNTSWIHNSTTATSGFYFYQQIQSAGNITAYSDARVKTNLEKIGNAVEKVKALNGYTYDRTDVDVPRQTGVIAQEVLEVLPEAVTQAGGDAEDHYAVAYGNMVGLLIEAIKEQQAQIDELKKPWWKRLFGL